MQTFGNSEVLIGYDDHIKGVVVAFAGTETKHGEWATDAVTDGCQCKKKFLRSFFCFCFFFCFA